MNFINLIPKIVKFMNLKKGSIVLLQFWGENKDLEILDKIAIEVAKNGAIPIRWQYSSEFIKEYYSNTPEEYLNFPEDYFEIFKIAHSVIDICMYTPPTPHKDFPKEKIKFYAAYMKKLFQCLSDKEYFIQLKVPTTENADYEKIDFEIFKNAMLNAYNIDYDKLKIRSEELVCKLKDCNSIEIYTDEDKKLSFKLNNRCWFKDDGTGSLPCGEIYIAPVENSVEGSIIIPLIYLDDITLKDVYMEFKDGKLINCSSEELFSFIKSFPGDSSILGEFGIGLNENVKNIMGYTPLDEKCMGTAHIALGMNFIFGGKNNSNFHMDYVFTPDKIEANGIVIMDKGSLLI